MTASPIATCNRVFKFLGLPKHLVKPRHLNPNWDGWDEPEVQTRLFFQRYYLPHVQGLVDFLGLVPPWDSWEYVKDARGRTIVQLRSDHPHRNRTNTAV
mmetsp:Transcript_71897/g.169246  ORF Transcript_71897/g.169246 Transcript_71897/m.169246 type:complete len:99 (+) Transcript_71897:150-446(+)